MDRPVPGLGILSPDLSADRETSHQLHDGFRAPLRVLPGNHDVGEPGTTPWAGFGITSERVGAFRDVFGPDHWVEVFDGWAVVGINSELMSSGLPEEIEQWEWLASVPDAVQGRATVLFLHKPLWSPAPGQTEHALSVGDSARERVLDLLSGIDLRVVGSGHLHR
jgi:3',5'-cyclic AMP phosphodiesterase CpdA